MDVSHSGIKSIFDFSLYGAFIIKGEESPKHQTSETIRAHGRHTECRLAVVHKREGSIVPGMTGNLSISIQVTGFASRDLANAMTTTPTSFLKSFVPQGHHQIDPRGAPGAGKGFVGSPRHLLADDPAFAAVRAFIAIATLFAAQCSDRVNKRGAAGRYRGCQQYHGHNDSDYYCVRKSIEILHVKEH